jgi:hypothetical protein
LNLRVLPDAICSAGVINALVFFIIGATVFEDVPAPAGIAAAWEILVSVGFFFDFIEIALIVIPLFYPLRLRTDFGGARRPRPLGDAMGDDPDGGQPAALVRDAAFGFPRFDMKEG